MLLLRLVFLALLYLFLALVALAAWRGLRGGGRRRADLSLLVLDPARSHRREGERIPIHPGATVGRQAGNAVVFDEDTVSAQHAVFHAENGRWSLEDLNSTNGTSINQRPLHGRAPLRNGDEIRFGRVAVRFGPAGDRSR